MRIKGKISSWNDKKGFGFITPDTGGKQVFIHIKAFSNCNQRPDINQVVTYELSEDKQGRPCAVKAELLGGNLQKNIKQKRVSVSIFIAVFFFIVVSVSVITSRIPPLIFVFYVAVSLLTFIMYASDKSAAIKGRWRIEESSLHLLSLIGGWPGAIVAQQKLRHKSKKQSFRLVFWVTVLLNSGAFFWLFTPKGSVALKFLTDAIRVTDISVLKMLL